jgi:hypothetical protein
VFTASAETRPQNSTTARVMISIVPRDPAPPDLGDRLVLRRLHDGHVVLAARGESPRARKQPSKSADF